MSVTQLCGGYAYDVTVNGFYDSNGYHDQSEISKANNLASLNDWTT